MKTLYKENLKILDMERNSAGIEMPGVGFLSTQKRTKNGQRLVRGADLQGPFL